MSGPKVVLITGVSSGIGRAAAIGLARAGRRVYGTVRDTAKAERIDGVTLIEMDIRDEASIERGVQAIIAEDSRRVGVRESRKRGTTWQLLTAQLRFAGIGVSDRMLRAAVVIFTGQPKR